MITLPDCDCINCHKQQLRVKRTERLYEDGSDPELWVATIMHVECGACGHKFQMSVCPEN
jgi:hypothetical protein